MTLFEQISLAVSFLSLIAVVIGLVYGAVQLKRGATQLQQAARQLSLTKDIHKENHDWNRRIAAQEAVREYGSLSISDQLQESFNYLNAIKPIDTKKINEEFVKFPNLQKELHLLLNYYEGLARGINQGLFDEEVIKVARKHTMVTTEHNFKKYITKRRKDEERPNAWIQLSSIAAKWNNEDNYVPVRGKVDG